jgi:hypothetical protein
VRTTVISRPRRTCLSRRDDAVRQSTHSSP